MKIKRVRQPYEETHLFDGMTPRQVSAFLSLIIWETVLGIIRLILFKGVFWWVPELYRSYRASLPNLSYEEMSTLPHRDSLLSLWALLCFLLMVLCGLVAYFEDAGALVLGFFPLLLYCALSFIHFEDLYYREPTTDWA